MFVASTFDGGGAVGECSGVCVAVSPADSAFGDGDRFSGGCFCAVYLIEDWSLSLSLSFILILNCHGVVGICLG